MRKERRGECLSQLASSSNVAGTSTQVTQQKHHAENRLMSPTCLRHSIISRSDWIREFGLGFAGDSDQEIHVANMLASSFPPSVMQLINFEL